MDKKTKMLLCIETLLIAVLMVVLAVSYDKVPTELPNAAHPVATSEHAAPAPVKAAPLAKAHETKAPVKAEAEPTSKAPAEAPAAKAAPVKTEAKPAEAKATPKAEAAPAAASGAKGDMIVMSAAIYPKHTKPLVTFTHKKHMTDHKIVCGECHHDDTGKPIAELKAGDPVESCAACHDKPGNAPKEAKGAERTAYHQVAMHANCVNCHKEYNRKNNTKAAPATCKECHAEGAAAKAPAVTAEPATAEVAPAEHKAEAVPAEHKAETAEAEAAPAEHKTETTEAKAAPAEHKAEAVEAKAAPAAGAATADVIQMKCGAYEHTKPIVAFPHKKHTTDYKALCGQCHHDDAGKPLAEMKQGDAAESCFACHDKPGKAPKEIKANERNQYHVNALHAMCIGCHKKNNQANKNQAAPATCNGCHKA